MSIKEQVKKHPESLVAKAYRFAEQAHAGQKRKTGEPYFNHVLATAEIVSDWNLDETAVAAALLHDTIEDADKDPADIRREFGEEVYFLVDGVAKISRVKYRQASAQVDNLRKLILALSEDLRVVLIKLADRLHNMRTLAVLPREKQKRIALETDEVYAPLAYRLGMHSLSSEFQNLAFPFLHPEDYRKLQQVVTKEFIAEQIRYLERIRDKLSEFLKEHHISPREIKFRVKGYGSLYKKMQKHQNSFDRVYDLLAMRIIVSDVAECYAALGVIHAAWPPLPGRIKDYIAMPKPNGYRSLHTNVIGPDNKIIEFQVRTTQMEEDNELGVTAHFLYKQRGGSMSFAKQESKQIAEELRIVRQLHDWQERLGNPEESSDDLLEAMKIELFRDRIFVVTPRGDVFDLPSGATPIDFAYHIHSEVGDTSTGAKVNGKLVPLDHTLRSGDLVEILTQKGKKPSEHWLAFAKTGAARGRIRSVLRQKRSGTLLSSALHTEFKISGRDRVGLIKDITSVIARARVNILSVNQQENAGRGNPTIRIVCDVSDPERVARLAEKISTVASVTEVTHHAV